MNALELHGLEKHYPDFALGPIDLELPGGTVCGLIGENGAGRRGSPRLPKPISAWCWAARASPPA